MSAGRGPGGELEAEAEHRPPPAGTLTNVLVAAAVTALGVATLAGSLSLGAGSARVPGWERAKIRPSGVAKPLIPSVAATATTRPVEIACSREMSHCWSS